MVDTIHATRDQTFSWTFEDLARTKTPIYTARVFRADPHLSSEVVLRFLARQRSSDFLSYQLLTLRAMHKLILGNMRRRAWIYINQVEYLNLSSVLSVSN